MLDDETTVRGIMIFIIVAMGALLNKRDKRITELEKKNDKLFYRIWTVCETLINDKKRGDEYKSE